MIEVKRTKVRGRKRFLKYFGPSVVLFFVALLAAPNPTWDYDRFPEFVLGGRKVTSVHLLGWHHDKWHSGSFETNHYWGIALVFTGRRPHLLVGLTQDYNGFKESETLS